MIVEVKIEWNQIKRRFFKDVEVVGVLVGGFFGKRIDFFLAIWKFFFTKKL